ncbi:hypothetical protein GCM10009733_080750 [Nonomuraea maheshkhaliensis]|uniref:ATPase AAA-type core domain-containing protein n=1 Tax=Nonomuraea maheshkhaliensis TaxID=419590 RepID=A0ABP4SLA7_9ACTN
MLTRIEIDGFKSFLDFTLDVPPFLAPVGPNSSGKSNLLDAPAFARAAIGAGLPHTRGADPLLDARRGKPQELFHQPAGCPPVSRFAVRVEAEVSVEGRNENTRAVMEARRESGDWSPEVSPEKARQKVWPLEVASWHFHVPDPQAMRRPVTAFDHQPLTEDAGNLAAVLGRMESTGALDDLMVDLSAPVPDVTGVRPILDDRQQERSFDLLVDHEPMPARPASDGTLRVLALLAALYDESCAGPLMVEEIENGLHPSRLGQLLERISQRVGRSGRLWRQVILTTHSPVAVSSLYQAAPDALVFLDSAWRTGGGSPPLPRHRGQAGTPGRRAGHLRRPAPGSYLSEHGRAAMSRPLVPGLITEGDTDALFLGPVIGRQLRALTDHAPRPVDVQSGQHGSCGMIKDDARIRQAIEELAADRHVIFLHSDHRERAKTDRHAEDSAVPSVPVRETEAWLLADADVWAGVPGTDVSHLPVRPRDAERISDPKAVLRAVLSGVSHRKAPEHFAFAGDHVDLSVLARLPAYPAWVDATSKALRNHGFL